MAHHRERHRSERIGWLRAAVTRGQRRHRVNRQPGRRYCRRRCNTPRRVGRWHSRPRRRRTIHGGGRIRVGQLSSGHGASGSGRERHELATEPQAEEDELTGIYVSRGLEPGLARTVARQLMAKGALAAHARDELGLTEELAARPLQAALASAATFAVGAGVPVLTILVAPTTTLVPVVAVVSLLCLVALGTMAARVGGAPMFVGAARVTIWGMLAMLATAAVGRLFGTAVG